MAFKEISVSELSNNVFDMIGKDWMLVTAAKSETDVNAMTASWGGLGIMWGKPVAFVFIRPQRYTKEYMDISENVTLSFYGEEYRSMLSDMGSKSGREEDKIKHENLTVQFDGNAPYFEEAGLVLKGKKLYCQEMGAEYTKVEAITEKFYPAGDWHTMYIYEIEKVLVRE